MIIYGANGYTGTLISRMAVMKGLRPTLAGRNEKEIKQLAMQLNLPYKIADLENKAELLALLKPHELVLHCAGPFSKTSQQMIAACLETKTHYLDITGEISVFEHTFSQDQAAKDVGIMLMSGVGFDVVPSDCLSVYLKEQLPDAVRLSIAFNTKGGMSVGTALSSLQKLGEASAIRKEGKLCSVPQAYQVESFPFKKRNLTCVNIPWGDLFTAYHSTGIPNIVTYMSLRPQMIKWVKFSNKISFLISQSWFKNLLASQIKKRVKKGPDALDRKTGYAIFYGEVQNEAGNTIKAQLVTPEAYQLTSETAIMIAEKVLLKNYSIGFQTPAMVYGPNLIMEVKGVSRTILT